MHIHQECWYGVGFGDKNTGIEPDTIRGRICPIPYDLPAKKLIFQHQVHGVAGHVITAPTSSSYEKSLVHDGDYLITNLPNIGVGVLTADCLAVLVADPVHRTVGAIHAGWCGLTGGIIATTLSHLSDAFGTNATDLFVWFGPCAHVCCYEVQQDFMQQLPKWAQKHIIQCEQKYFFDLPDAATGALLRGGVDERRIQTYFSKCTICNDQFCSYRRNAGASARQMSIIWLN